MKDARHDPVARDAAAPGGASPGAVARAQPHPAGLPPKFAPKTPAGKIAPFARTGNRRAAALSALAAGALVALAAGLLLAPPGRAAALAVFAAAALAACASGPPAPFGAANRITLLRAGGAAVFAGLVLDPAPLAGAGGWAAAGAGVLLLALDGVDGWLARREGRASAWGARFDMEVDALTMLVLSALLAVLGKAGAWILAIGLMRYAFLAAGRLVPRLARPLPASGLRRTVCAVQVGTLVALLAPPLAPPVSSALAAAALALLAWSFARDLRWLLRRP